MKLRYLDPRVLRDEAQKEGYKYFDQNIRKIFNLPNGQKAKLADNDVDAFRHAYASGIFTQVYGEAAADFFGRINEGFLIGWYLNKIEDNNPKRLNMELWNNEVGRAYGKKAKDRKQLLEMLHRALKNGELIVDLNDSRDYKGAKPTSVNKAKTHHRPERRGEGAQRSFLRFG